MHIHITTEKRGDLNRRRRETRDSATVSLSLTVIIDRLLLGESRWGTVKGAGATSASDRHCRPPQLEEEARASPHLPSATEPLPGQPACPDRPPRGRAGQSPRHPTKGLSREESHPPCGVSVRRTLARTRPCAGAPETAELRLQHGTVRRFPEAA